MDDPEAKTQDNIMIKGLVKQKSSLMINDNSSVESWKQNWIDLSYIKTEWKNIRNSLQHKMQHQ